MYKLAWRDEGIVIIICCNEYIYIYCICFEDVVLKKERRERKKENKKERGRSKDYVSRVARMRRLIYDGPKVYDRLSCD